MARWGLSHVGGGLLRRSSLDLCGGKGLKRVVALYRRTAMIIRNWWVRKSMML